MNLNLLFNEYLIYQCLYISHLHIEVKHIRQVNKITTIATRMKIMTAHLILALHNQSSENE